MEEAELVRKMISGDKEAFAGLMERYQSQALRAAYLISGNYADSEDIVQETFTACYLNRKQIRNPEAFKGWFYRTLSRTAWKVCRKKKWEQPAEEIYPQELEAPGELLGGIIAKEEEDILYGEILKLPVKQRTVIILFYYNQMSIKEIAGICGCLEGTVKSRLSVGKKRLRKALMNHDQEGGTIWTILS